MTKPSHELMVRPSSLTSRSLTHTIPALSVLLAVCLQPLNTAQAQVAFYQGKTVTIIVGQPPGAVSDAWARLYSRYMGKHIPGNPDIIVQNRPGAGSRIAANYVYGVARPDGLTLGAIQNGLYLDQLVGVKEAKFDWSRFTWIGSPEQTSEMLYMRSDTPYKSFEDIRKSTVPPKCGSTGPGSNSHFLPLLFGQALNLRFNMVSGYPGAPDIDLAVERGEVHCRGGTVGAFLGREPGRTWAKTGFVRVLVQGGKKRDPRLPDVPTIWELMEQNKTPEDIRRVVTVLLAAGRFGRPFVGSPGISAEPVKILREASSKALKEPELLEDVKKRGMDMDPISGEELQALAREVIDQPPEIIEKLKKVLGLD